MEPKRRCNNVAEIERSENVSQKREVDETKLYSQGQFSYSSPVL